MGHEGRRAQVVGDIAIHHDVIECLDDLVGLFLGDLGLPEVKLLEVLESLQVYHPCVRDLPAPFQIENFKIRQPLQFFSELFV